MVEAQSAGVLFTADPITGRRRRAAIEAVRGLGEQLVSGAVNPDHYTVNTRSGAVLERRGDILGDAQLRELAALGARIEEHFGRPQDIEWDIDKDGKVWIVQSRDITTLYPLPSAAPDDEEDLHVYFSANVAQGVFAPFTPMGLQTFRLLSSGLAAAIGRPVRDPSAGASLYAESAMRVFIDLTPVLRDPFGREVPGRVMSVMEFRSKAIFEKLLQDPRLRPRGSASRSRLRVLGAALHTGAPQNAVRALVWPDATRNRLLAELDRAIAAIRIPEKSAERLDAYQDLILKFPPKFFPRMVGLVIPGVLSYALANRLLGTHARPGELQTVLRGLPHNPTTEMDLGLWRIARAAREDPASRDALVARSPAELSAQYRARALPPLLQREMTGFLERYGHRAIAEIDLGVKRWSEDPAHLLGAIANYLRLGDDATAPDVQFARGAHEAEAMIKTLAARLHGPRRVILRFLLGRVRLLSGLREQPKFQIMRIFALGHVLVAPSTDPGWTPLFLTAGALVMEMGGMMSHGAVVAREYGIPAVVGVPDATGRIATGEQVTVDGSAGTVARQEAAL